MGSFAELVSFLLTFVLSHGLVNMHLGSRGLHIEHDVLLRKSATLASESIRQSNLQSLITSIEMATLFLSLFQLFSFLFKSLSLFFQSLALLLLHLLKSLSLLLSLLALFLLLVLLFLFVMLSFVDLAYFLVFFIFTELGLRLNPVLNLRDKALTLFLIFALTSLLIINFILLPVGPIFPVSIIPIVKVIILVKITPIELLPVVTFPVLKVELLKPILLILFIPVLPAFRNDVSILFTD